jgi:hypothetical protein
MRCALDLQALRCAWPIRSVSDSPGILAGGWGSLRLSAVDERIREGGEHSAVHLCPGLMRITYHL